MLYPGQGNLVNADFGSGRLRRMGNGPIRLDGSRRGDYMPVRPAKSSIPQPLVIAMSLINRQMLAAIVLAFAASRSANAADSAPTCDLCGAESRQSGDGADQNPCWWMPGNTRCSKKCALPFGFESYQPEGEAPQPPPALRSLIEEAESLLDTPRFDQRAFGGGGFIDVDRAIPATKPSGDQFSRSWSDGAPLLLFDWSGKSSDPLAGSLRQDGVQRIASSAAASDFADLSTKVKLRDRDSQLDPSVRSAWETDQTVKVPVAGSVFFFNQVSGSTPDVDQQQYKWLGKSGVGLKVKPWLFQEVQVRTGPVVRFDDTGTLTKGQSPEHSELFVEAVTKVPVPVVGPVNVEYSSYAVPAATSADRNAINQDFKVALPIGGGQFHVGAKYKWEAASATPWMDRMQVYMGVQNKW
jgi:hypothetical protein